jgi:hypothetical protein
MDTRRVKTFEEITATNDVHYLNNYLPFRQRRWLGAPLSFIPENLRSVFPRSEYVTDCTKEEFENYKTYNEKYESIVANVAYTSSQSKLMSEFEFTYIKDPIAWVCSNPTFNCQLASFASFQILLGSGLGESTTEIILRRIAYTIGKYLFYFDVNWPQKGYIDRLCFEKINPNMYISTNGSKMYDGKILINK